MLQRIGEISIQLSFYALIDNAIILIALKYLHITIRYCHLNAIYIEKTYLLSYKNYPCKRTFRISLCSINDTK